MAGALPNIGYHISEKELIRGTNVCIFDHEPARLLGAFKPGSRARMDSTTGGEGVDRDDEGDEGGEGVTMARQPTEKER